MKVESKLTINNRPVDLVFTCKGISFYEVIDRESGDKEYYITKDSEVIFNQYISADCAQNFGFVEGVNFTKIEAR